MWYLYNYDDDDDSVCISVNYYMYTERQGEERSNVRARVLVHMCCVSVYLYIDIYGVYK